MIKFCLSAIARSMVKITSASGFLFVVLFSSCQHGSVGVATVSGTFTDAGGLKLIFQEMDTHEIHSVDSVVPDQGGTFVFSPVIKEPGFWLIKAPSGKILVLFLNAGDQVDLTGSMRDFPDNVVMEGPKEAMLLNEFYRHTRNNERQVDSLEMLLIDRQDSSDYYQLTQKLDTNFRDIWENQRNYETAFINNHTGSLAALVVLNYAFGMSPVLSPVEDSIYYQRLDSALFNIYPENKHVKFHHQRVLDLKNKVHQVN
ncbi:MAG: DUF4369 domain-containing protein [Bacteroidetes bacterium]|nr:DUF4369 domain-containing protein [Bacteroidota bacterium]